MDIAPGGVGLPDLDQHIRLRPAGLVQHPAGNDNALALRFAALGTVAGQIGIEFAHCIVAEHRAGDLG